MQVLLLRSLFNNGVKKVIKLILRKIRLLSNARKEPYLIFYRILGFFPDNIDYYRQALSHRSLSVADSSGKMLSNERLEFLGDAVLGSVVTDILFHKYSEKDEGFLTNTRSKIVRRESLNRLAVQIGIDKLTNASPYINTNTNKNIYGNALEALLGAIYLDYGYKKCKQFFENKILKQYIDIEKLTQSDENFKSKLIEWSQKNRINVEYIMLSDELLEPNRHIFHVSLLIDGKQISTGVGPSKKIAEQNASANALKYIESDGFLSGE